MSERFGIQGIERDLRAGERIFIPQSTNPFFGAEELGKKQDIAALVQVIRSNALASTTNYTSEKAVRLLFESLKITGVFQASKPTLDELNAFGGNNGDWGVVNVLDGDNKPGIYVTNGTAYSLVKETVDLVALTIAQAESKTNEDQGTLSGKVLNEVVLNILDGAHIEKYISQTVQQGSKFKFMLPAEMKSWTSVDVIFRGFNVNIFGNSILTISRSLLDSGHSLFTHTFHSDQDDQVTELAIYNFSVQSYADGYVEIQLDRAGFSRLDNGFFHTRNSNGSYAITGVVFKGIKKQ